MYNLLNQMADSPEKKSVGEKRGPVEKTEKGWPINPVGIVALALFALVIIFLIIRPLLSNKTQIINVTEQQVAKGGQMTSPTAGEIVKSKTLEIKLSIDEPQKVQKVQFWAKTYANGKWQMIGEVSSAPFSLNWRIPADFQNKAIAITSHIYQKDSQIIKDPGGWREGIIILSQ